MSKPKDTPTRRLSPRSDSVGFVPGTEWQVSSSGVWLNGPHTGKCAVDHSTIVTGFCINCGKLNEAKSDEPTV